MTYKDLEGEDSKWWPKSKPRKNASKNHKLALEILKEIYPNVTAYEECLLPIQSLKLYLDILVPDLMIAIEVDGMQHDKYNPHFHSSAMAFMKQVKHDRLKEEWCDANNIELIRLKENNKNGWRDQLSQR